MYEKVYGRWLVMVCLLALMLTLGRVAAQDAVDDVMQIGRLYEPMSFTIDIVADIYENPFDGNDVELVGFFQAPGGEQYIIQGFWMQPYRNTCDAPCYDLQEDGDPVWMVRFTPQQVGRWTYTLQVRDNSTIIDVKDGRFEVEDSALPGFVRLGENGRYFAYSNGTPYFPVGHNLNWSFDEIGGLETYVQWLEQLAASGGNYARLFIDVPWFIGLEWDRPAGSYLMAQEKAAMLDVILDAAAEYGIQLQLVLIWNQALRTYTSPPVVLPEDWARPDTSADWFDHPYNTLNGGVISAPAAFPFDDAVQALLRQRLRYIVARWGYSPQIFAWEMIDRIEQPTGYDIETYAPWLQGVVSYVRQLDSHQHLVTASGRGYQPVLAQASILDFISAQFYQRRPIESTGDQVIGVVDLINQYLMHDKPVLLVDYSLNPWFEPTAEDPEGIHFQNSLWAAALGGAAGGAMSDWWDTYVIPQGLDAYYVPLNAFVSGIAWDTLNLQPAQASLILIEADSTPTLDYGPVRVDGYVRQLSARVNTITTHVITADGVLPDVSSVPSYIYGQVFNSQYSYAQRYQVTLPMDTYLEVGVNSVSTQAGARLIVEVDSQRMIDLDLSAGSRNTVLRVPLSAGEHTIVLDNLGDDWLELGYLELGAMVAPARVYTLVDTDTGVALAWLQHRGYTWDQVATGESRIPLTFEYRLDNMPAGRYVVELWNPVDGGVLGEDIVRVGEDGQLSVMLLPFDSQMALRIIREQDTGLVTEVPVSTVSATDTPSVTITPQPTVSTRPMATDRPVATALPTLAPVRSTPAVVISSTATVTATPEDD